MQTISEWKKRPKSYKLNHNERMVMAIVDGQTHHCKMKDDKIIQLGNKSLEKKRIEKNVFKALTMWDDVEEIAKDQKQQ